jgi:hypothetical protein
VHFSDKVSTVSPALIPVNFGKIFKLQMHAGKFQRILQTKINTLTPVIMPANFVKSQSLLIFNALRPKTLEENRDEAPQKLWNSSIAIYSIGR